MRVLDGRDGVRAARDTELGVSGWKTVGQHEIDAFAAVTGDDYWLHTDPGRAAETPLGGTIAHGLLTLALGPAFTYEIVEFRGFATTLNYGYEKVRFVSPVACGARVRMRSRLVDVLEAPTGVRVWLEQTFELDGADRPACVAQSVLQLVD